MIVLLAISFMLITNLSYVELFTLLRVRAVKLIEGIKLRAANRPAAVPVVNSRPARASRVTTPEPADDDDYFEEDDGSDQQLPRRGQSKLLGRITGWFSGAARQSQPEVMGDPEDEVTDIIITDPRGAGHLQNDSSGRCSSGGVWRGGLPG